MNDIAKYSNSDSDDDFIGPPVPEALKVKTSEEPEAGIQGVDSLKITDKQVDPARPEEEAEEDFIGPPVPENFKNNDEEIGPPVPEALKPSTSSASSNDDLIGPPVPKDFETSVNDTADDDDDELIGPPIPDAFKAPAAPLQTHKYSGRNQVESLQRTSKDDEGSSEEESDEEESDEEEHTVDHSSVIPIDAHVSINHGTKAVTALTLDSAGSRLATGSVDYDVKFWDFAGMDNSLKSFRRLTPSGNNPIKSLSYSSTGDNILVVSGMSQAKILDREGHEILECVKGDQYITDMSRTKGHVATLTSGAWHPKNKSEFATASEDGTCRTWDLWQRRNANLHTGIIKCRSQSGLRTVPTSISYSRDGNLICCACMDGSIQMWDTRKLFVNPAMTMRNAHQQNNEISGIHYSYSGQFLASRSCDETLKVWDIRSFQKPLFVAKDLYTRYPMTDCMFSPNDQIVVTAESMKKGETSGKLHFYDIASSTKLHQVDVEGAHVIKVNWHPRLQQIFIGCGNGVVQAYYSEESGSRGAKNCAKIVRRKKKQVEVFASQQIITPHALPLFRQERHKSRRKRMLKDRLDPVKSHRPDLPIESGQGGRVAVSGSTLSSYVMRNLGLSKRVEDDQDPREAILKYAKDAEENPYWIAPAYAKTQPKPIFRTDEVKDEPATKKSKL